ncbi:hypothetical protein [Granulicella sp. L46]|uniref:hypothetical protein n=1 Tax=Granulicella sp. L46 TaxID=1641865 RepID=UPI00131C5FCF|nr:hypothetical protein [Granulicella sp. L46]
MQMTQERFNDVMAVATKNVVQEERELFGNRRQLPLDESAVVFNLRLTHEEKLLRLAIIREAKAVRRNARKRAVQSPVVTTPITFGGLITDADTIHARAFGISLS